MRHALRSLVLAGVAGAGAWFPHPAAGQLGARRIAPPDFGPGPANHPRVVGWPAGRMPAAPPGFRVSLYAEGFENSRWLYVLPNGDVLVSEANQPPQPAEYADPARLRTQLEAGVRGPTPNRITLLRDVDRDGLPDVRATFLDSLNQPFGMALVGDQLYVANTDGIVRFPYRTGATRVDARGTRVYELPAGGYNNHWTRNLLASRDGAKLYVTVGSGTNVDEERYDEKDPRRAAITELNLDGTGARVFAGGLRNPNGLAWEPTTGALWAAVNERDYLGDNSVDDYITSVRDGAFYGWPYAYYGPNEDPRKSGERPDLVQRTVPFDVRLGAHTASMDVDFYTGAMFPSAYRGGAFVTQRGSWNRSEPSGFKVLFVPFADGRPSGPPRDFLTGFLEAARGGQGGQRPSAYGRPVGIAVLPDGSLLVADDGADRVWRVSYSGPADAPLPNASAAAPSARRPLPLPANAAARRVVLDSSAGFRNPESAAYHAASDVWYVSNINSGTGPERARLDNNGFVSRVTGDGRVERLRFIAGGEGGATLNGPKGLLIVDGTLWVADVDHVRGFDLQTGAPRANVDVRPLGAKFLNDLALGPDGALYVTDMGMLIDSEGVNRHAGPDRVFRVDPRTRAAAVACAFDPAALQRPNGIAYDARGGRFLLVAMGEQSRGVYAWRPGEACARPQAIGEGPGTHDGVLVLPDGRVVVSSHATRTLNVITPGAPSAPIAVGLPQPGDIGLDPRRGRIAVPIVADHRLEFWDLPGVAGGVNTPAARVPR